MIERRADLTSPDLLLFTSDSRHTPLAFAGTPLLTLRIWSSARSVDVVGRLCLVNKSGTSINLCEGLTRVDALPDEESIGATKGAKGREVVVELGPVAAELCVGESLRLHVCSAAHPRWMRNLCASPEVPLAKQRSGNFASCRVHVSVDAGMSVLALPVLPSASLDEAY